MGTIRILQVEDEAMIAFCQKLELKQAGYDVIYSAVTGEEAVHAMQREIPDLVLMDIRLAGDMDGVEAAKEILSIARIPIIFMTGYSNPETREKAMRLKPLDYLIKPVAIQDLQPVIESHFHR